MANERDKLATAIRALLIAAAAPLKARDIADALYRMGVPVTRTVVNSVLYGELATDDTIVQDREFRWSSTQKELSTATATPEPPHDVVPTSLLSVASTVPTQTTPEERRIARRILQVLRSGTTSCLAARALSVGTARIEQELYSKADALLGDGTKGDMIVIAGDWGFGKSHMRMLLSSHLSERRIPFIHECIDARAASLSHVHRAVSRWLERIQFGRTIGLRDALENGNLSREQALGWASRNRSDFAYGLRSALAGVEWGWLLALGHLYRAPDYPYQHPKAWALFESVANFLAAMNCGGLVVLLDEAENIDKQYDIRGRRKSYDTLGRMARHPNILPVLFVTDRLLYQIEQDHQQGTYDGWANWTTEAKWFTTRFREIEPIRPPRLTDKLAEQLVTSIESLYRTAYPSSSKLPADDVLEHWRRTPTRSTRLLVRLTINELDLLAQGNGRK